VDIYNFKKDGVSGILLIRGPAPVRKWAFMIAIVLLSACVCVRIHCTSCLICPVVCVHVSVPRRISAGSWKRAHHCRVRGRGGGGEPTEGGATEEQGIVDAILSVSDGPDNRR